MIKYKYKDWLLENNSKDYYILYHSTDSDFFSTINFKKAKKGERFYNPLGNGLYCSTNINFSKTFGKNVYYYLLPKNSKIKKITYKSWTQNTYQSILKKILKLYNIDYWNDLTAIQKYELMKLSNDTPISSLNELSEVLSARDLGYNLPNIQENMEKIVDNMNYKYDAIWYKNTDYYLKADEILIPPNSFKKELFFKKLPKI